MPPIGRVKEIGRYPVKGMAGEKLEQCNIGSFGLSGAITRAQQGCPFDTTMLRTVIKQAEQNLGIYGSILSESIVRVGDTVNNTLNNTAYNTANDTGSN